MKRHMAHVTVLRGCTDKYELTGLDRVLDLVAAFAIDPFGTKGIVRYTFATEWQMKDQ